MRKTLSVFFLFVLFSWSVCADSTTTASTAEATTETTTAPTEASQPTAKTLSVVWQNGRGSIESDVQGYTFWEYPLLGSGGIRQPGVLTVRNDTAYAVQISLESISLPYDSDAALEYLAALEMTVWQSGEVIYQGPYTAVNDQNGLRCAFTLEPNQQTVWKIALQCPFAYQGEDPQEISQPCIWNFRATATTQQTGSSEADLPIEEDKVKLLVMGAGAVLLVCAVSAVIYYFRSRV